MHGVVRTTVGYTGGYGAHPTYESVCQGDGHTEAAQHVCMFTSFHLHMFRLF